MPGNKNISVGYNSVSYWAPAELRQKEIVVLEKGLALRITSWVDSYPDPIAVTQEVITLSEEQVQLSAEALARQLDGVVARKASTTI